MDDLPLSLELFSFSTSRSERTVCVLDSVFPRQWVERIVVLVAVRRVVLIVFSTKLVL